MEINLGNSPSYIAFISYKHDEVSIKEAKAIQKFLETFKVPKDYSSRRTLGSVFRDKDELAVSHDLNETIKNALDHSEFLIVVCSKLTRQSEWVKKEIAHFLEKHGEEKIIYLVAEGNPEDVIPDPALEDQSGSSRTKLPAIPGSKSKDNSSETYRHEPLAACIGDGDNRTKNKKRKEEYLRIAAAILGCTYDNLYQRSKRRQLRQFAIYSVCILSLFFVFGIIYLNQKHQTKIEALNHRVANSYNLVREAEDLFLAGERTSALQKTVESLEQHETDAGLKMLAEVTGIYEPDEVRVENVLSIDGEIQSFTVSSKGDIFVLTYVENVNSNWKNYKYYLLSLTSQGAVRWKLDLDEIFPEGLKFFYDTSLHYSEKFDSLTLVCFSEAFVFNGSNGNLIWQSPQNIIPLHIDDDKTHFIFINGEYLDETSLKFQEDKTVFSILKAVDGKNGLQIETEEYTVPAEFYIYSSYAYSSGGLERCFQSWNEAHDKLLLVLTQSVSLDEILNMDNVRIADNTAPSELTSPVLISPLILNLNTGQWENGDNILLSENPSSISAGFNDRNEIWLIINNLKGDTLHTSAWFYDQFLQFQLKDEAVSYADLMEDSTASKETHSLTFKGDVLSTFARYVIYLNTYNEELVKVLQLDSPVIDISPYKEIESSESPLTSAVTAYVMLQNGNLNMLQFSGIENNIKKAAVNEFSFPASVHQAKIGNIDSVLLAVFTLDPFESGVKNKIHLINNPNNDEALLEYPSATILPRYFHSDPSGEFICLSASADGKEGAFIIDIPSKKGVTFIPYEDVGTGDFYLPPDAVVLVPGQTKIIFSGLNTEGPFILYDWVSQTVDQYREGVRSARSLTSENMIYVWIDHETSTLSWTYSDDPLSTESTNLPFTIEDGKSVYFNLDKNHNILVEGVQYGSWSFNPVLNEWTMIDSDPLHPFKYDTLSEFSMNENHLLISGYEHQGETSRSGFYLLKKSGKKWKEEFFFPDYNYGWLDPDDSYFLLLGQKGNADIYDRKTCELLQSLNIEYDSEPEVWIDPATGYLIIGAEKVTHPKKGYVINPKSGGIIQEIRQLAGWSFADRGFWIESYEEYSYPLEFHEFLVDDGLRELAGSMWNDLLPDQAPPPYLH